jgi:hypothetical protein
MGFYKFMMAAILIAACTAQETVSSVLTVLNKAQASGSIAYWSKDKCDSRDHVSLPSRPIIRPTNSSGSPIEILKGMFADDLKMRVTKEVGGLVRMYETDVPHDLLDIKIHHISFPGKYAPTRSSVFALWTIMQTPEVQAFAKERNIGPLYSNHFPGNPFPNQPELRGELTDVTVSQALDYVLLTYPGYWVYANCTNEAGDREVFFAFVQNGLR